MNDVQRKFGYTRIIAMLTLIPSGVWFAAVAVRYIPRFLNEPDDLSLVLPFLYWLSTTSLAIAMLVHPPQHFIKHAFRGVLEGAILAYIHILYAYLRRPDQWSDGTFEWGILVVGLVYSGMFFSLVGAIVHCMYAAIRFRMRRNSVSD